MRDKKTYEYLRSPLSAKPSDRESNWESELMLQNDMLQKGQYIVHILVQCTLSRYSQITMLQTHRRILDDIQRSVSPALSFLEDSTICTLVLQRCKGNLTVDGITSSKW